MRTRLEIVQAVMSDFANDPAARSGAAMNPSKSVFVSG